MGGPEEEFEDLAVKKNLERKEKKLREDKGTDRRTVTRERVGDLMRRNWGAEIVGVLVQKTD